jgi:hypothetical protein
MNMRSVEVRRGAEGVGFVFHPLQSIAIGRTVDSEYC